MTDSTTATPTLRLRRAAPALLLVAAVFLAACEPAPSGEVRDRVNSQRQARGVSALIEVSSNSALAQNWAQAAANANDAASYAGSTGSADEGTCGGYAGATASTTAAATDKAASLNALYTNTRARSGGFGAVVKDGRSYVAVIWEGPC